MERIKIQDIKNYDNKNIIISGFVDKIRDLQYVQFLILRDGTGKVQITIEKNDENQELNKIVSNITLESTIKVDGKVLINDKVKLGGVEIIPNNIILTSISLNELPFDIKSKDNALRETRLDYRFLDLRREENNLLFKCQTLFEHELRNYWINHDFMEIHSPKISGAVAESGAETFKLDYFGQQACLSQSPQFYKQMALAAGFNQVFEIGPAFRAENSHTSYHATEINMADVEIAWIDSEEDIMDHEENLLRYAFSKLENKYKEEIMEKFHIEMPLYKEKFPRITFEDAKKILKEKYNYVGSNPLDLERKEEELMWKYAKENYNSDFIFITSYPFEARPFYHMLNENNTTKSFDLIFKGVEITTGSQREHRIDVLEKQIEYKKLQKENLNFYLDFFKYGCPPHGGFAIGIARVMMKIFELDNIREATYIYRGPTRLNP